MEVRVEDGSINSEAVTSQTQSENFVDNGWASFPEVAKREEDLHLQTKNSLIYR